MSATSVPIEHLYLGLYDGPHATPKPSEEGPIFLGIGNITEDGKLDLSDVRHISEEDFPMWTKRVTPRAGDIVFTYEATLNRYAIIPDGFRGCLGRRTALIRPNTAAVNPRFLFFYFFSEDWRRTIDRNILSGATVDRIPLTKFSSFPVTLPSRSTQDKIADTLSAYDDLIENNTRRIKILEEMAQMLYREWFVNFSFPDHQKVRLVDSELGPIPEGWSVKPLGEVADVTMGLSPKGDTYNEEGIGTPLINGPVEFGDRFTKAVKWTTRPTKCCEKGDLIVCVRGSTTGRYVKSDGVYCLGRGVCAMSGRHQSFVDLLYVEELPTLLAQTGGSTFPSWTGPQLKFHPVKCPPDCLLERFEMIAGPMRDAVACYSRSSANLRTTRDFLLPKLISGEILVGTADDTTAESMTEELALPA